MTRMKKILASAVAIAGLAAALSYWQIERLADTPLTINQETIYTLPAGSAGSCWKLSWKASTSFLKVSGLERC